MNLQESLKNWRLSLDMYANSIKVLPASREASLAFTAMQRAKMWLGKCMEELGTPTPYPQSENPDSKAIEPPADHTEETIFNSGTESTETAKVKMLRQVLEKTIIGMKHGVSAIHEGAGNSHFFSIAIQEAYISAVDAKMWLGMRLGAIRETEQSKSI
jgi:hypothetical protein